MRAKSNIGPDDGGFNYELQLTPMREHPDIVASIVSWGDAVAGNAREILAEAETVRDDDSKVSALNEAKDFLLDLLMDGPVDAKECKAAAASAALSLETVKRAKLALNIASVKNGMKGGWNWQLPSTRPEGVHQNPKGFTPERLTPFANHEPLRGLSEAVVDRLEGEI